MAMAYRFCILLFFVFAISCSARNTIFLSEAESIVVGSHGRSLKVKLDDYGEASANTGHDPRNRGGNGRGGGRRTP